MLLLSLVVDGELQSAILALLVPGGDELEFFLKTWMINIQTEQPVGIGDCVSEVGFNLNYLKCTFAFPASPINLSPGPYPTIVGVSLKLASLVMISTPPLFATAMQET